MSRHFKSILLEIRTQLALVIGPGVGAIFGSNGYISDEVARSPTLIEVCMPIDCNVCPHNLHGATLFEAVKSIARTIRLTHSMKTVSSLY